MRKPDFTRRRVLAGAAVGSALVPMLRSQTGIDRARAETEQSGLTATIEELDSPVNAGEYLRVETAVENAGSEPIETDVDLVVGHDPERLSRITATIGAGETRSFRQGFYTYPVPRDEEFPVRVDVEGDADERTAAVTAASDLETKIPDGDLTISPETTVQFEVEALDPDERQQTLWWVDGEQVGTSMNPLPAIYYAERGAHYWQETFESPGTVDVAAAVIPDDGDGTYAARWEVDVGDEGARSPSIDEFRPDEEVVGVADDDEITFELDVSDDNGGLDRVVWWLSQADAILDVSDVSGEQDTATLSVDGGGLCHTCRVDPWVLCADGRAARLEETWEIDRHWDEGDGDGGELTVDIRGTNAPVDAGEYLEVIVDLENTGEQRRDDELELVVGHDPAVLDTQDVTVAAGETGAATLGFETYPTNHDEQFPVRVVGADGSDEVTVQVFA
ncbi:hypothetical protein OB905_13840 [Halobacteria archaeon AArc-dxtr1]|nr:hypothetical protein [Halobacteria archaeon AArc-dxtr1]